MFETSRSVLNAALLLAIFGLFLFDYLVRIKNNCENWSYKHKQNISKHSINKNGQYIIEGTHNDKNRTYENARNTPQNRTIHINNTVLFHILCIMPYIINHFQYQVS